MAASDVSRRGPAALDAAMPQPSLSAAAELTAYEGLRRWDEQAFRSIAHPLQPLLRRLVALSIDDPDVARHVVADTWRGVFRSLGMFTWNSSLTSWIAGFALQRARRHATTPDGSVGPASPPSDTDTDTATDTATGTAPHRTQHPGPDDWSDLPFGARWRGATDPLRDVHARLPWSERVALHVHHVERWSRQDGCDLLGLTAVEHCEALEAAHRRLHDVLALHVGDGRGDVDLLQARVTNIGAALRLLHGPAGGPDGPLDPLVLGVYREWVAGTAPMSRRVMAGLRRAGRAVTGRG